MTTPRTLQLLALVAAGSFIVVGCQTYEPQLNANLAPPPPENLVFADTTQPVRDYPQSVSYIQNGDTVGDGSIGFRYRSSDNLAAWQYPIVEPGVFAANVVTLPYTMIAERGDDHISSGLQFPPTYTAMPPYPNANNIAPETPPAPPVQAGTASSDQLAPSVASNAPSTTMPAAIEQAENRPDQVLIATTNEPGAPAFTIVGQVLRPGTYDARNLKLSQVVTAAGPSSEDPAKVKVQIDRPGEESASTTLDQLLSGDVEDVELKAGDVITIGVTP